VRSSTWLAPESAALTSPSSTTWRAVAGLSRSAWASSPSGGMPGQGFQRTASWAQACSACSSRSATTPTKSRITTTARMPGMWAMERSSTLSSVLPMNSPWSAPA
jgi:hypothetical protein